MTGDVCETCGQPLPDQSEDCLCGHSKTSHNIVKGRVKTECSRFGPRGKCPCLKYTPLGVPVERQP